MLTAALAVSLASGTALPAQASTATERWVDAAAEATGAGTACGADAGYTTIAAAVSAAAAGDTIRVCAGRYEEGEITVAKTGLSFLGAQAGVSAGVGGARSADTSTGESVLVGSLKITAAFVTVDGFEFTNSAGHGIFTLGNGDGETIVNNRFVGISQKAITSYGDIEKVGYILFLNTGWAVHHDDSRTIGGLVTDNVMRGGSYFVSSSARELTIDSNQVSGLAQRGVTLYGTLLIVRDNVIDFPATAAGAAAVQVRASASSVEIAGNTITGERPAVNVLDGASDVRVRNNKLLTTGATVVGAAAAPYAVAANWWGSASGPTADRLTDATVERWCLDEQCAAIGRETPPAPAADSSGLDDLLANDPNYADGSNDVSGPSAPLTAVDPGAPFSATMTWNDASDDYADVWAFSSPVFLGTFPVVNGTVQITGVDLSQLEAGGHRIVVIGSTSGTARVFAITVRGLAATGPAETLPFVIAGGVTLLAGLGLVTLSVIRRRSTDRPRGRRVASH